MKNISTFGLKLALAILLVFGTISLDAQYGKKKKRRPEQKTETTKDQGIRINRDDDSDDGYSRIDWREKLWYGAGFQLGFSGNNRESFFSIGASPLVGYKITDFWSAGPRINYNYLAYRRDNGNRILKENVHSFGIGAFTRVQFFEQFMIHVEYEKLFSQQIFIGPNDLLKEGFNQNLLNIGAGLYQGNPRGLGFAEYLVLDVLYERETASIPIQFRLEINYNFW